MEIVKDGDGRRVEVWFEEGAMDWAPLRTVFPDHADLSQWGWQEATVSPDTGAVVHCYKMSFIGRLWLDEFGRVYRFRCPDGPRLIPGDRRVALLHELLQLLEGNPDDLPRVVRLVAPEQPPSELQQPLRVVSSDPDCQGCTNERARADGPAPS